MGCGASTDASATSQPYEKRIQRPLSAESGPDVEAEVAAVGGPRVNGPSVESIALASTQQSIKVPDVEDDNLEHLENEEAQANALKAIHEAITSAGLTAPARGPPEVPPPDKFTSLVGLPDCLTDLHYGMPPAVKQAPMRLLKIAAMISSWTNLKVYEEVDAEVEAPEMPYKDTDDDLWRRVVTVSWRWAESKPAELQPGFSPMSGDQFKELKALLRVAEGCGIEFVWIDWSCVPQYSQDTMVEIHRSKVFYARSRAMYVLPTFNPLPGEGPVRLILAKAQRVLAKNAEAGSARCLVAAAVIDGILEKNFVAGREYFGRVWTLAERMARHGRGEGLWQWLSLEAWLGMLVDAMLKSTEDRASSLIYKKMLGRSAARLLDEVLAPLAAAVRTGSVQVPSAEGLETKVADLCQAAVGVWMSPSLLAEAPTRKWLHAYLGEEATSGVYQAFSESDRVWAIYSYFCWKSHRDRRSAEALVAALGDLVEIAAGDRREYRAGMFAQLGIDGRTASEKRREEEEQQAVAAAAIAAAEQRKRDDEAATQRAAHELTPQAEEWLEMDRQGQWSRIARANAVLADLHGLVSCLGDKDARMQERAARVLVNLAVNDDGRVTIAQAGAIPPLVRLLSSQDAGVQTQAAWALKNLAGNDDNQVTIAQAGAIPPLVQLLSSQDARVQEWAAAALKNLAANDDNEVSIALAGAIPPLVRLLSSQDAGVQTYAAGALKNLTFNPGNKVSIAQAGAIPPLVRLLSCQDAGMQTTVARALDNLAVIADNKVSIAQAGAIPVLKKLMASPDSDVREWAGAALQQLEF